MIHGGRSAFNLILTDTWERNGSTWARVTSAGPSRREGTAMAYDAPRDQIVLFGGYYAAAYLSDTWVWDGTDWIPLDPGSGPSPRFVHGMAYAGDGKTVVFGGCGGGMIFSCSGDLPNDTWVWNGGGLARPAQTWRVQIGAAGFDELAELIDARATVYGAGIGFHGGETRGAALWLWNAGEWQQVDTNAADPDSADTSAWALTWQTANRLAFNRARIGPNQDIHFAVVPAADNGPGGATREYGEVRVDYAELTLRYRLP